MAIKYNYGTQKYREGLSGAQEMWANQYATDPKANEIGRYLDYQNTLGLSGLNKTYGGGVNINDAQHDFFNKYSNAIKSGTNNLGQLKQYQGYAKAFGLQAAAPNEDVMRQLSIAALNGSKGAQNYLNTMGITPMSGLDVWKGIDPNTLEKGSGSYNQYEKDNPYSGLTKSDDKSLYDQFSGILKSGQQIDANQASIYQGLAQKWGLSDLTDPMNLQEAKMKDDQQNALNAQDVALNQSLSSIDAKNFQTMLSTQQGMTNRGLADSGIAADAYQRATMAANQDITKAYSDAATNKAGINSTYADKINDLKLKVGDQQLQAQKLANDAEASRQENLLKLQQMQSDQALELQKLQSSQDQFMTAQSGYIWIGGKPLTDASGNPISTLDYQQLSETQRHNLQTEALSAQQNNNTYQLGMINANNDATRIANSLSIAQGQMALDLKNFDLNSQKFQLTSAQVQAQLENAAINTTNDALKIQITALKSQLGDATRRANEYTKKGDKVPDSLEKELADINNKIQDVAAKVQGEQ